MTESEDDERQGFPSSPEAVSNINPVLPPGQDCGWLTLPLHRRVIPNFPSKKNFSNWAFSIDAKHETQRHAIRKEPKNKAVWYLATSLFPRQRL